MVVLVWQSTVYIVMLLLTVTVCCRGNPKQIFELFVEIGRPSEGDQEPFILQQYPADYGDEDVLKSVSKFAFPCANERSAGLL